MNYDLYIFFKTTKLKFWKHKCLRKLRKYIFMLYEPYNYPFSPSYMSLIDLIEWQRLHCYIYGYDTYDLSKLSKIVEGSKK